MLWAIVKSCNWVDVFILIILIRVCYISLKIGFVAEVFKLAGLLFSMYLACHYFTFISDLISTNVKLRYLPPLMPVEFLDFIVFVLLVFVGYGLFVLLRETLGKLIHTEAVATLNKWGGLLVGFIRGVLLASLVAFMLSITSISYFKNSTYQSYFGSRLFYVTPVIYSGMWNGLISKFMVFEKYNKTVDEIRDDFSAPPKVKKEKE
ncbi:MAG TPA: CvpA family protein [Candidatus Omnitrophota bacterium]|nr:CvpA family protein [Candidatus Omnitrophota bacterium]